MKKTLVIIAFLLFFSSTAVHAFEGIKETSKDPEQDGHVEATDKKQTKEEPSMIEEFADDVVECFLSWEWAAGGTLKIFK